MKWTEGRIKKLKFMWRAGKSGSKIADALGITRSAVLGKLHRLGLKLTPAENLKRRSVPWTPKRRAKYTATMKAMRS